MAFDYKKEYKEFILYKNISDADKKRISYERR